MTSAGLVSVFGICLIPGHPQNILRRREAEFVKLPSTSVATAVMHMESPDIAQAESLRVMTKSGAARNADDITASPPPSILKKPTSAAGVPASAKELRDHGSSKSPKASTQSTPGSTRKTLNDFFQRVSGTKAAVPTPSTTGTARNLRQGAEDTVVEDASVGEDNKDMELDTTPLYKVRL